MKSRPNCRDDLIDEFEDMQNITSANKLKKDYYEKADNFYTLLVNLQAELGFYLSDKKINHNQNSELPTPPHYATVYHLYIKQHLQQEQLPQ